MGIREQLNRRPLLGFGIAVAVIVVAVTLVAWQMKAHDPTVPNAKMFLTTDDGKTCFSYGGQKLPPFPVDGKTAVRALMFSCDGGKTKWVAYLARYMRPGQDGSGGPQEKPEATTRPETGGGMMDGIEVKRPGDADWVKATDPRAAPFSE